MGFFKTLYRNQTHFVVLTDFDNQGRDVYLHFDTGAVCTVISIEAFVAEKIDKTKFTQQIKSRANRRIFHSASGNQMEGYLVCAENIKMSGAYLSKFFYYLIVDVDERVGLLGDDFISKSRFEPKSRNDNSEEFYSEEFHSLGPWQMPRGVLSADIATKPAIDLIFRTNRCRKTAYLPEMVTPDTAM